MSSVETTREWDEESSYLFANLISSQDSSNEVAVCVDHKRFLPCRVCMYSKLALTPYSSEESDIKIVRDYQSGSDERN